MSAVNWLLICVHNWQWLMRSARQLRHAGNFMLLNEDDRSPLKAIDFGLAVLYDPASLPRSDLGLEGTPW